MDLSIINNKLEIITNSLELQNYVCSIEILEQPISANLNRVSWLKSLLGSKTKVFGLEKSTLDNIVQKLEIYLNYNQNSNIFIDKNKFCLLEQNESYKEVIVEIKNLFSNNEEIFQIDLSSDSYPMYAIIWKFAFFIKTNASGFLLIGSASD